MHQIAEEIFEHDPISPRAYMIFKMESCFQKLTGNPKISYADARKELVECEKTSKGDEMEIVVCSMKVAGARE